MASRGHILVVDDERSIRRLLRMYLSDAGYTVAEVSCPTRYAAEASSINFSRSVRYGLGCLATGVEFRLARAGLLRSRHFPAALRIRSRSEP